MNLHHTCLKTVTNTLSDAFISSDISGKIVHFNSVAEAMTGYSASQAIGKNYRDFLQSDEGHDAAHPAHKPDNTHTSR